MAQLRKGDGIPFTQVPNYIMQDDSISWKAKALFAFLLSKPEGWNFSAKRIAEEGKGGYRRVLSGLDELEEEGYLERKKNNDGKMDYILQLQRKTNETVNASTQADGKNVENRNLRKPQPAETGTISNKENKSNNNAIQCNNNKSSKESNTEESNDSYGAEINSVIAKFEDINPSYERLFPMKGQRDAVKRLIEKFGYEKVVNLVDSLPQFLEDKYFPDIRTPYQLEAKLGKIKGYFQRKKVDQEQKTVTNLA